MIRTTRGARRLVAALVAVLLAGVVGLVSAASSTRTDAERAATSLADAGDPAQYRATATIVQADDDHGVVADFPTAILGPGLNLLAAALTAVAAAMIAACRSTVPAVANGRAPPVG